MSRIPAPSLNIPSSSSICKVSIIDTTCRMLTPSSFILMPSIPGHETLLAPSFSFLIENVALKRSLLFDLGLRKDWENASPSVVKMIQDSGVVLEMNSYKDVADILVDNGVDLASIEGVVWSHSHIDHIGNPSTFPPSTSLIVGPGFKETVLPGYPAYLEGRILESDYMGRNIRQISFDNDSGTLTIGRYQAVDYFNDGSFYLLNSPGHDVGHMCALVRTTPSTFMFLGGDVCHHAAEFRPTEYLPLPSHIPNFKHHSTTPCPCSFFAQMHPKQSRTEAYYTIAVSPEGQSLAIDVEEACRSIVKMEEFDGNEDIFTVIAHDLSLIGVVDFFPKIANAWKERGWGEKGRWEFLKEFQSTR